ncbi:hypothetical protein SAMN05192575_10729 [Nocardioides alpinus]|uniref:Uncharacterized protein n=1 Tax=Nocardioides alpinus TaxID=748909 RepID=A0A1I1A1V7_9ACTN|nr:hypothetical protein [Nocardioides alpinus]PKH42260.1 hypothetical protein CXG46_07280 [Nocardioides alpinus]SFB30568.1 hypothetical protein SAMN05192575_10729 [Nocardioides alpinus]
MTDAPDLTPEQDAVRRLLADARHDAPTPPEVVAHLDATLASLVADRGEAPAASDAPSRPAPVADLAARRRRMAGIGLLAAAAVVVAGVAIGQGLPRMSSDDSAAGSAADGDMSTSQERDFGSQEDSGGADSGGAESESGAAEMGPESLKSTAPSPGAAYPTLSTADADLDQQLLGLRSDAGARRNPLASPSQPDAFCMLGIGPGRRLAAEIDGQPGVVVYSPRSGDAQEVALFVCGDGEPVRTLFLPLP